MLEQRIYSAYEIDKIIQYAHAQDNLQAATEALHHRRYFRKTVVVTSGRKAPIGTSGKVFWLARRHYGSNPWLGWQTRIGIREQDGTVHFLSVENVEIVKK